MTKLAHAILCQLVAAIWIAAIWVLYCTPGVHASHRTPHRRADRGAHPRGRRHVPHLLGSPRHAMAGAAEVKDLDGSAHIAAWTCLVMRIHAGATQPSRKRR